VTEVNGKEFCFILVFLGVASGSQGLRSNLAEFSQVPEVHEPPEAKKCGHLSEVKLHKLANTDTPV
jgi:hypothetical protein